MAWRCWRRRRSSVIRTAGICSCSVGRGRLIKVLWHDGQGTCPYAKRLERGRFMAGADRRCRISGYRNKLGCPKRPADCVIVDLASAHALIIAERQALSVAESEAQ